MKAGELIRTKAYSKDTKKYSYGVIVSVIAPAFICVHMYGGKYKGRHLYLRGYDLQATEVLG